MCLWARMSISHNTDISSKKTTKTTYAISIILQCVYIYIQCITIDYKWLQIALFLFFCSYMLSFHTQISLPSSHRGTDSWHLRAPPNVERPVKHPHNILTFSEKTGREGDIFMAKLKEIDGDWGIRVYSNISQDVWTVCTEYVQNLHQRNY